MRELFISKISGLYFQPPITIIISTKIRVLIIKPTGICLELSFAAKDSSKHIPIGLIISTLIFVEIIIVIGGWKYKPEIFDINNSFTQLSVSNTHSLGQILYTDYIHVFQISGMILLVAMIGAIVLTFRQRAGVKRQSYIKQISRERAEGVEILEVETNKGVRIDD